MEREEIGKGKRIEWDNKKDGNEEGDGKDLNKSGKKVIIEKNEEIKKRKKGYGNNKKKRGWSKNKGSIESIEGWWRWGVMRNWSKRKGEKWGKDGNEGSLIVY